MNLIKKILLIKICESLLLGNAFAAGPLITDVKMIKPDVRSEIVNTSPAFTGLASSVTAVTSGLVTETAARTAADALLLPLAGGTVTGPLNVASMTVNGSVSFPGLAPAAGNVLTSDALGNASWHAPEANAVLSATQTWTGTNTFQNPINETGGQISVTAGGINGYDSTNTLLRYGLYGDNATPGTLTLKDTQGNGITLLGQGFVNYILGTGGTLGIGTNSPAVNYTLDVNGNAYINGPLVERNGGTQLDGLGASYINGNGGTLGVGTKTPDISYELDVAGGVHVSTNAVIDGSINAGGVNVSDGGAYTLGGVSVILSSTVLQSYYLGGAGTSGALGMQNTATGWGALAVNTGDQNTAYGWNALGKNTNGVLNTAIGLSALQYNTIGFANVALGDYSLAYNINGQNNTALGYASLGLNTSGTGNTAGGYQALNANSSGYSNTAYGQGALMGNTIGTFNTAVGPYSLALSTSSSNNTAIGYYTGIGITYGSANTIIGANVTGLAPGLSNNIILADGNGNQRINVDATGQVGIGTATPGYKLDVVGGIHASSNTVIDGTLTAASAALGFVQVSSACATATTCIATCPGSAHGMGGSCSGATTAPESALGANSFTCTAGVAENLNAVVACVNIN
jgi:hypothetical protein